MLQCGIAVLCIFNRGSSVLSERPKARGKLSMTSVSPHDRNDHYFDAARRAGCLLNRANRKTPNPKTLLEYSLLPLEEHLFRTVEGMSSYDLPGMLVDLINGGLDDTRIRNTRTGKYERIVDVLLALTDSLDRERVERDRRTFGNIDFDPYGSPLTYGKYLVKKPLEKCICCGNSVPVAFHASQPWDGPDEENGRFCSTRCYVANMTAQDL